MSVHRLLQRGFAHLFGYKMPDQSCKCPAAEQLPEITSIEAELSLDQYAASNAALLAHSSKDLHYKMKGSRFWSQHRMCNSNEWYETYFQVQV